MTKKKVAEKAAPKKAATNTKPVKKAFPLIAKNDLNRLLEQTAIYQNRVATANGSLGEMVREYASKKHLHTGAFGFIKRLYKLGERDPQALWLFLAHFDDMRTKSNLDRTAKSQGQLLPAVTEDRGQPAEDTNVVDYPQPREVEEQAGAA